MTPRVWPNWHSIGYDDPHLLRHIWCFNILAWKALGDHTFDLLVAAPPLTSPIPVTLRSPPVPASNITGSSGNPTTKSQDKGKGKAVFADPDPEAEGSRKRKSPMISEPSSQPLKSVMKTHKCLRLTCIVKSKPFIELEDDDDEPIIKPFSGGVLEVILPHSPQVPMKKPFGPAKVIASSCLAVVEPMQPTPEPPVEAPQINISSILIPGPNNPCQACNKQDWPCATQFNKRTGNPCMSYVYCTTKKIKCILVTVGSLPKCTWASSTTWTLRSRTPSKAGSKAPPTSQSKA
ncbi:hypothetical protein BDR05DRAFT_1000147 [Suillus weaverae]|nr:hypothetical protein BDR05DRAFT_1000147 [Suillus weaverae]